MHPTRLVAGGSTTVVYVVTPVTSPFVDLETQLICRMGVLAVA